VDMFLVNDSHVWLVGLGAEHVKRNSYFW